MVAPKPRPAPKPILPQKWYNVDIVKNKKGSKMETATQELIYQAMMIIISLGLTVLSIYAKKFITTKIDIAKYGFENDRVERILDNAVNYAESYAREYAKKTSAKISGKEKLSTAKVYINEADPEIIRKYGGQLNDMLSRKVIQVLGK